MAEKNTDGEDFRGANQLRVDNGGNWSVQPCLHLITRETAEIARTATDTRDVGKFY